MKKAFLAVAVGSMLLVGCTTDPEIYQEFFNKLSQSIFLTANDI